MNIQIFKNKIVLRLFVSSLMIVSFTEAEAKYSLFSDEMLKIGSREIAQSDTSKHLGKAIAAGHSKFEYSELLYQRLYGEDKLSVNGTTIDKVLKNAVAESKYRDVALALLGAEGWELSVAVTRELSAGFEILFYLKKKID